MTIHVPGCPSSIAHALSYLPVGEGVLYVAPSTWLAAFDQGVNHFFTVSWALSSHHQFTKFYVTHGFFHTSASWLQAYKYPTMESYSCTCELLIHCILTWAMVVHWSPPHAKSMCLLISDMRVLCKSLSIIHFTFTSLIISWCCFGLFWTSQTLSLLYSGWPSVQPGLASCALPLTQQGMSLFPKERGIGNTAATAKGVLAIPRPRSTYSIHLLCYSPLRPTRLILSQQKSINYCQSFLDKS